MSRLTSDCGQATVEAAALLGILMLLFALLLQPVCLLFTTAIMRHAAAETLRVLETGSSTRDARSFALRRLSGVPETSIFHVRGERDWAIHCDVPNEEGVARVRIVGHARPLPLFGAVASMACETDEVGIVLRVEESMCVRPEWLEGDYESWMSCWN